MQVCGRDRSTFYHDLLIKVEETIKVDGFLVMAYPHYCHLHSDGMIFEGRRGPNFLVPHVVVVTLQVTLL
jgi:hypothetical protein